MDRELVNTEKLIKKQLSGIQPSSSLHKEKLRLQLFSSMADKRDNRLDYVMLKSDDDLSEDDLERIAGGMTADEGEIYIPE